MKLEAIKIGEELFAPADFSKARFWEAFRGVCVSLIDQKEGKNNIYEAGRKILSQISDVTKLNTKQQLILTCLEIKTKIELIFSGEKSIPNTEELSVFDATDISDIIFWDSDEDAYISSLIKDIMEGKIKKKKKEEVQTAVSLLKEINYQELSYLDAESICDYIIEFEYNSLILDFLEQQWIYVYNYIVTQSWNGIILERKIDTQTSFFHIPNVYYGEVQKIHCPQWTNSYFWKIPFNSSFVILSLRDGKAVLWGIEEIWKFKRVELSLTPDFEYADLWNNRGENPLLDQSYHLYIESLNTLHPLWIFFHEPDQETGNYRFYLTPERTKYVLFDGETFSKVFEVNPSPHTPDRVIQQF